MVTCITAFLPLLHSYGNKAILNQLNLQAVYQLPLKLPNSTNIGNCYILLDLNPRIEIDAGDVTNVSSVEFSHLCERLSSEINIWLNSESFRHIEQQLRTYLHLDEEIRFIIETSDNLLKRLPWHLWQFFEDYPTEEVALSATEYQKPKKLVTKNKSKVRMLAIFGNSKGIDLRKDRLFLEQLSDAEIEFLVEPVPEILHDKLWQEWDILFFAGHSYSQEQGIIQLNQTDAIALDKLKYALEAICGIM